MDQSAIRSTGSAQSLHGNPGGWPEYEINDPEKNMDIIDTITDGQGNIVQQSEYKPFGEQYRIDTNISQPLLTNRGYTGHEHINEFGFIHMNGRVYDPSIGRFQVADPSVPYVFDSQSYNRYSYTRNNPLKYTDPSGYCDVGDNAGTDDEDMGDDGGSDGGGGGNYFDGEAEEQWYRENVYTDIDIAYNKAFSDGVPGVAPSPSDGDLYISHFERFLANNVQKVGYKQRFWENRQLRGDPVANIGLSSLNPSGGIIDYLFGGTAINNRLQAFAKQYIGKPLNINKVRGDLIKAHVSRTDHSLYGALSARDIAEYHHEVFGNYGLPSTAFGGTPWTGSLLEADLTSPVWCWRCE